MIRQVKIKLTLPTEQTRPNYSWAYALYGELMSFVETEYAQSLHQQSQTPINQYLINDKSSSCCYWTLNLFGEASDAFIPVLSQKEYYFLKKFNARLIVSGVEIGKTITEEELCKKYLVDDEPCKEITIHHLTPCSFKSEGDYAIFPTKEWIIQSCANKWNGVSEKYRIEDSQAIQHLVDYSRISRYNLRSTTFNMKSAKIPSFTGSVTLKVGGPQSLIRLFNLIISFGEYSGIGIKSALGMGGCTVERTHKTSVSDASQIL